MGFDDLLKHYFGTAEIEDISAAERDAATKRISEDFWQEKDRSHRFLTWSLLYMLGNAPDLDSAFSEAADRRLAVDFMVRLGRDAKDGL